MLTGKLRGCVAAVIFAILRLVEYARFSSSHSSKPFKLFTAQIFAPIIYLAPVLAHSATLYLYPFSLSQVTSAL